MPGPKTTCTQEVQDLIVSAISAGAIFEVAAAYAGVKKETLKDWLRKGRAGKAPYAAFVGSLDEALAKSEVSALRMIQAAGLYDWKAAAWYLERKWPERWGRKWQTTGAELSEDGQMLSDDQLAEMTDEELEKVIDAVAKASAKRVNSAARNGG